MSCPGAQVAGAAAWLDVARPLIRASIEVDQIRDECIAPVDGTASAEAASRAAGRLLGQAASALCREIESVRDSHIAEVVGNSPAGGDEVEWQAYESLAETIAAATPTVAQALRKIRDEMIDAAIRRPARPYRPAG